MAQATRIKYVKKENGILETKQGFLSITDGNLYHIKIDTVAKRFIVYTKNDIVSMHDYDSLTKAKKQVKIKLGRLGVVFYDEVRAKRKET